MKLWVFFRIWLLDENVVVMYLFKPTLEGDYLLDELVPIVQRWTVIVICNIFFIVNLLSEKSARARLNAFDQKDSQWRWNIFSSKSVHFRSAKKGELDWVLTVYALKKDVENAVSGNRQLVLVEEVILNSFLVVFIAVEIVLL